MSVRRKHLENCLGTRGWKYHDETKRTKIFRKPGVEHQIFVKKGETLREESAASHLRQAGYTEQEIENFLKSGARTNTKPDKAD